MRLDEITHEHIHLFERGGVGICICIGVDPSGTVQQTNGKERQQPEPGCIALHAAASRVAQQVPSADVGWMDGWMVWCEVMREAEMCRCRCSRTLEDVSR